MDMTPSQLRAFHLVVESGSFSAAARDSGLSQPNLSGQVAALDGDWSDELAWTRDGKALLVTARYHAFRLPIDGGAATDLGPGTSSADCGDAIVTRVWDWSGAR